MVDETSDPPGPATPASGGTRARLTAVVREQFKFVFRFLRRLGMPRPDAEDAAQRVFMKLSERIAQVAPGMEIGVAYRLARSEAANHRQKKQRQGEVVLSQRGLNTTPCPRPRAPEQLESCELLDEVLAAVPLELRVVFILSELEQKTRAEIAAIQGLPEGTVASRHRRACDLFRAKARELSTIVDEGRGGS